MINKRLMVRNAASGVVNFVKKNPLVTVIFVLFLVWITWSFGATVKESFFAWRYGNKVEKLDEQIKTDEQKSRDADTEANIINQEGDKKLNEYRQSNSETQRLRREIDGKNRRIADLQRQLDSAG